MADSTWIQPLATGPSISIDELRQVLQRAGLDICTSAERKVLTMLGACTAAELAEMHKTSHRAGIATDAEMERRGQ